MRKVRMDLAAAFLVIGAPLVASAHHSNAPHYDYYQPITIEGTVHR
jgi:hypothetical protein